MRTHVTYLAALLVLGVGCGDDDGVATDAGGRADTSVTPTDSGARDTGTGTDAGRTDAGSVDSGGVDSGGGGGGMHCDGDEILIAAVDPGSSVTVFNPTSAALSVTADLTTYQLCSQPAYSLLSARDASATIPAGGSHTFSWTWPDTNAGGEMAIYVDASFGSPTSMVDFVCWGTGHAAVSSRKDEAETAGLWSGDCVGAVTGAELVRIPDTDGTGAASYDPTGAAGDLSCP